MKYFTTTKKGSAVSFFDAVLSNMASDGSLFMPEFAPVLSSGFFQSLPKLSFHEMTFEVLWPFVKESFSKNTLAEVVEKAFTFDAPLVTLTNDLYVLELFHGPTAAFKDFGVRFLAQVLLQLQQYQEKELTILTATSGDTGGAVADAFFNMPGIQAFILYPKEKVSALQELQIASLGGNIHALEVDGSFDDCQRLVKWAFHDPEIKAKRNLSSANSINIARLLPQSCYYLRGWAQLNNPNATPSFSVPSGNFGNVTAGLLAKEMGLPCSGFMAATNSNDTVPRYMRSGVYAPAPLRETISNAMDITDPSNFVRAQTLAHNDLSQLKETLTSIAFSEEETRTAIHEVYSRYEYIVDPHTAISYLGAKTLKSLPRICLSTAHPIKFAPTIEMILERSIEPPQQVKDLFNKRKITRRIKPTQVLVKEVLLG